MPTDVTGAGVAYCFFRDFFIDRCKRRRPLTFGSDGLCVVQAVETLLLYPS
jgi:hypothetical protein